MPPKASKANKASQAAQAAQPETSDPDTIRILISTDNHVGYNERDAERGEDSWKTFDEIMRLAKDRDVDMVLLAGDLFHENKPSRRSMYQVMQSLRMNCLGDKPCELEMLSDGSEAFGGQFNHVNYEDTDINVAIPVFSIHGNHDDPSGEAGGHLAALDILQMSGLINYYGRTPESDNIVVKPVLLQKGHTKLALYGMSNVRDERLFRTFRDKKVKFFQPNTQKDEWFNLMSVHQNHAAHTETSYLPENFLPESMDLIIWGHEHECLIDPKYNPEMGFHVMQPGSSVATSLSPGETVAKHVAVLSVTGKQFKSEPIRLKTVRPFVLKDISLQNVRELKEYSGREENRTRVTQYLMGVVDKLILQATNEWREAQEGTEAADEKPPLPIIRLRVEYSAPDGGKFDCENPQRFSNRFIGKVANTQDVVQFYRKKTAATRKAKDAPDLPEEHIMAQLSLDSVKVEKLVREFLTAQSLTILPQNLFGDAVSQFVDKDDKHAMEVFLESSLVKQVKHLEQPDQEDEEFDEDEIHNMMEGFKAMMEEEFAAGNLQRPRGARKVRPKPDNWDSDENGAWADQTEAQIPASDDDFGESEDDAGPRSKATPAARGRGSRGRGSRAALGTTRGTAAASTRKKAAAKSASKPAAKAAPAKGRGRQKVVEEEDEEESDVIMLDDEDEEEAEVEPSQASSGLFVSERPSTRAPATRKTPARSAAASRQTNINFGASQAQTQTGQAKSRSRRQEPSDEDISDDDDAFETMPTRRGR